MRKKACVIDHTFHQKTNSFDFIIDFLSKKYDLTFYWSDSFEEALHVDTDIINQYDIAFFFQILNPIQELKKVTAKIIWIPMYDGIEFNDEYWELLAAVPIKIIFFCKKLYDYAMRFGFDGLYVQHFKHNESYPNVEDYTTRRVFFWYRGDISLHTVLQLLAKNDIASMDVLNVPDSDTDNEQIDKHLPKDLAINFHGGFLTREEYLNLVSKNNIYIAPRLKEGMGMSFLEAMAMGHCIIAHDDATMNEYITHGQNGYLFDANAPDPLDLSEYKRMSKNSLIHNTEGWKRWETDIDRIYGFIEKSNIHLKKKIMNYTKYMKSKITGKIRYHIRQLKRIES